MRGDWVDLYQSRDIRSWEYVHRFYERDQSGKWTHESEDDMCPSFLPLPSRPEGGLPSGKYLQLFIAHNKGCQYYIGGYKKDEDIFVPEVHGRMTWADNTFFAPEALVDGKGRQIMWAWLLDNPGDSHAAQQRGWSGVYGLPRVLWLGEDGTLRMATPPELRVLRCNEQSWPREQVAPGKIKGLPIKNSASCELEMTVDPKADVRAGLLVLASPGEEEVTRLYYDAGEGCLVFDARKSSLAGIGRPVLEKAPFKLQPGEKLHLRVFVDKCVVEVFANDRQAITRRVYPIRKDGLGVHLFCEGGSAEFTSITAWELAPSNPY
jgi:beta-fructofuranosidase